MALVTRVTRLFQADLHAVLDQIEEPEVLLRQAIREMEEELDRGQRQLALLTRQDQGLAAREAELSAALERTAADLEACLRSDARDLARGLVRRRLETERAQRLLARRRAALGEALDRLRARLAADRERLDLARQKAEALVQDPDAGPTEPPWDLAEAPVRDEDVEVALLRALAGRAQP